VNVAEFRRRPGRAVVVVAPRVAPGGRVVLITQSPGGEPPGGAANAAPAAELVAWGFVVEPETPAARGASAVSVLRASLPPGHRPARAPERCPRPVPQCPRPGWARGAKCGGRRAGADG
jgi:hypothetical protein